ncbi:MAG: L-threonylcarbamoyladenylate synthase [Erysipelotrichaceae bacterium]|nr:L-threonylcarbamoyladenylate synthase [Erysipelotrichaceae bacterium]
MKTKLLTNKDIKEVAAIIRKDGIVAFPTDTVYGLGIRYDSRMAIDKLKLAKKRPETKPFPMMVNSLKQIEMVAELNERDRFLIKRWLPNALTIVFRKRKDLADYVTNGFDTVAIRMPNDEFVLSIIDFVQVPLLVPSANISNEAPAKTHEEVLEQLDSTIDAVVIGKCSKGIASTIISTVDEEIKLLREGPITLQEILDSLEDMK